MLQNGIEDIRATVRGNLTCEDDVERESKPHRLMESMYQMDGIKYRLQTLINKIRDGNCPQETCNNIDGIRNEVTMSYVLNEAPEYMNKICEEMHEVITAIEAELW